MIQKTNLKILTINLDYTLAMDFPDFGDAQQRNVEYGKYVEKIFSITHSQKILNLKNKKLSEQVEIFPTSSLHPIFFLFDALKIAKKIFKENKIDLVLTQDPFITGLIGYLIKGKYGCSFLIHFHGDFWQNKYWLKEKWYNWILLWLSKFLVKKADGIKVVSSGIKDKLIQVGLPKDKIRIIPTPVDLNKFSNFNESLVKKLRQQNNNQKTIINVGRNDPSKDYKTLLRAISLVEKNNKMAFWQIGAKTKKINQSELVNYYYASDIYVSSSCHESFGKVLIEAMACGLPIVATATTGSKEIIVDKLNGFLVPIGDTLALANKVMYLLNNSERAKQMGKAGQKIVIEKFNQMAIIEKIIQFWQDLT